MAPQRYEPSPRGCIRSSSPFIDPDTYNTELQHPLFENVNSQLSFGDLELDSPHRSSKAKAKGYASPPSSPRMVNSSTLSEPEVSDGGDSESDWDAEAAEQPTGITEWEWSHKVGLRKAAEKRAMRRARRLRRKGKKSPKMNERKMSKKERIRNKKEEASDATEEPEHEAFHSSRKSKGEKGEE